MLWPKKNSYKEFDNEKKFLRLENSSPPHNFSNGLSLNSLHSIRPTHCLHRSCRRRVTPLGILRKLQHV